MSLLVLSEVSVVNCLQIDSLVTDKKLKRMNNSKAICLLKKRRLLVASSTAVFP